jgi:dipeptidyl aminopeptidase/acylaminoacyl peptidase
MATAMQAASKPYKLVLIKDTDHYFQTQDAQRQLFSAIGEFLQVQLK